jgi:hypothetical protein
MMTRPSDACLVRLDKLMQMKYVLERGGHFSGINRKIQIKATKWKASGRQDVISGVSSSDTSRPQRLVRVGWPIRWSGMAHAMPRIGARMGPVTGPQ